METQIVKQEVPSLELPNLESALETTEKLSAELIPMRERAQAMEIKDAASYAEMGALLTEERNIRKNTIIPLFAPFNGIINRVREFIRVKQQAVENTCEEIDAIARSKMKVWERQEAEATAKEQEKLSETRPGAVVQPNIPSVSGYRRSTTYPVTIEKPDLLIKAWYEAMKKRDRKRANFLIRFITANEAELKAYARELKDPEQFMKELPGIKCRKD